MNSSVVGWLIYIIGYLATYYVFKFTDKDDDRSWLDVFGFMAISLFWPLVLPIALVGFLILYLFDSKPPKWL